MCHHFINLSWSFSENVFPRILALFKKTPLSNNGRLHWQFLRHFILVISDNCQCHYLHWGFPYHESRGLFYFHMSFCVWASIREVEMHLLTALYNAHQGRENSQQAEKRLPCSGRWRFSDYYLIIRISSLQCQWLPTLVTTEQSGYFEMTHREPGDICICIWTWICICNCIWISTFKAQHKSKSKHKGKNLLTSLQ